MPDWRSDAPPRDSDSEAEAVPSSHTKKKKKRRKRQKQVEISAEEAQNGDLDVVSKEEKTVTQKKKKANKSGEWQNGWRLTFLPLKTPNVLFFLTL